MEPDTATERLLRAEVRRFATACGTLRSPGTDLHLGVLAGARLVVPVDPRADAGLRADLVTRAVAALRTPERVSVWLTRRGHPDVGDIDLAWLSATGLGFGRHGLAPPAFFTITRHGWVDVRSGAVRTWRRVRPLDRAR